MTPSIATLLARGALAALLLCAGGAGLAHAQGEVPATQDMGGAAPADAGSDEGMGTEGQEASDGVVTLPAGSEVSGTIVGFECGDNCYLTIRTNEGQDVTGLCSAEACTPWLEEAAMPAEFVGRPVEAVTGIGTQVDGSGTAMGETTAFATLTVGE